MGSYHRIYPPQTQKLESGHFSFFRNGQPDRSCHHENLTFNQNMCSQISQILNNMHVVDGIFSENSLKHLFHFQNDKSGRSVPTFGNYPSSSTLGVKKLIYCSL